MTRPRIRTSVAALGSAAILALAGCGGASTTSTTNGAAQGAPPQGRPGGPLGQANLGALAADLGVSTTRLQQALAAARPAGRPPRGAAPGGRPQGSGPPPGGAGRPRGQLAANLAKQLKLPTAKVQQALAKVLPGRPPGAAPPGTSTTSANPS